MARTRGYGAVRRLGTVRRLGAVRGAAVLAAAGGLLAACGPGTVGAAAPGTAAPSRAASASPAPSGRPSGTAEPGGPASRPAAPAPSASVPSAPVPSAPVPSAPASRGPAGGASGRPAPGGTASAACSPGGLAASGARRLEPSNPDGTYAVLVSLTNRGPGSCVLQGFPSVAVAGQGDPRRNRPLRTVREGAARPVRLAPGGRAWVRVTLVSVLGEGDGYCASGATPAAPPSLVLGVPGGGIQVGVADGGLFAECDDRARTTAFLADRP